MRRICATVGVLFLVGCATGSGPVDLVYGPQRIPPPTTGSAAVASRGSTAGPYYPGSRNSPSSAAPSRPAQPLPSSNPPSSNALPPSSSPYVPPDGTFDYRGSSSRSGSRSGTPFRPLSSGGAQGPASGSNSAPSPFRPSAPASPTPPAGSPQPGASSSGPAAARPDSANEDRSLAAAQQGWKPAGSGLRTSGQPASLFARRRSRESATGATSPPVRPVRYEIPQNNSARR